ncbi:MAG: D-glycero-beta-D-manno-heptose 1,7-bisphosphate 7-phosphatase [Acidobacteria bacterium]|nr:D-glycero-beta-D-manno-heptose 1,7-bisphosphate 7-phosphatase [Acidobacteriota bacterium]
MGENKAVFLDRDGTINEEVGFIDDPEKLKLIPKAGEALKKLKDAGFLLVVVTNQSGIARGYITEEKLKEVHKRLRKLLSSYGVVLDGIYYCPHHPEGLPPYRENCPCRKPAPGMILKAKEELGINISSSFVVGDKPEDIELGKKLGMKTVLVLTGFGKGSRKKLEDKGILPDFVAEDVGEAVEFILGRRE